ncbi:MAG: hypothetical protein LBQ81_09520 [Zoogloeaceae bacterium]|jgi:hypothetical protein|nr:hypothetical protein [Zoogloeaceae bacterium]
MNAGKPAGGCGACAHCRHCHESEATPPETGASAQPVEAQAGRKTIPVLSTLTARAAVRGDVDLALAAVL